MNCIFKNHSQLHISKWTIIKYIVLKEALIMANKKLSLIVILISIYFPSAIYADCQYSYNDFKLKPEGVII